MQDEQDCVVIGGGHNGLVAAIELARAGWSVLVIEAGDRVGGCAATTEPLLANFRHNPHANSFLYADLMPKEIEPRTLGVGTRQPAAQFGVAFADGRPPVILHRPDLLARTAASLGVYSPADARLYAELKRRSAGLTPLLKQGLYAPPDPNWFQAHQTAVQRRYSGFYDPGKQGGNTARALIDSLFESPEVRILFYSLAIETGVALDELGGGFSFLGYSIWIAGRWRIPEGGMQSYSDALQRLALACGVRLETATRATRIVREAGRAVGVETSRGNLHRASLAVVAATPILQLFDNLVEEGAISAAERGEMAVFRQTRPTSIGTTAYCLDEAPRYKSARHDAEIDACLKTVVGYQSPADVLEQDADIRRGRLPRPAGVVRIHSLWDESLAPGPFHLAGVDSAFPAASLLDEETWGFIDASFPSAFLETWRSHFAPGNGPQVFAMGFEHSHSFERRMLLRMGPDQYRSSINGLYLAGPGVYPGGGVHGACGRNAARTILNDFAAPRPPIREIRAG